MATSEEVEAGGNASLPVAVGDVIEQKLRVDRILGEGGMGVVVAATHLHLEQPVALKFMRPEVFRVPELANRFLREARATVRLKGENVCRVYDVALLDESIPYIVMEFLEGEDLGELLERGGVLSTEEAVEYVLQACVGVAEAHAKSIIHRDLKPQNLFLTQGPDGKPLVKVLDFGISKTVDSELQREVTTTKTGRIMGSPAFMSPEQMTSARKVDARSDIWALGAILCQLVSGEPPFRGDTLPELCAKVLRDPPDAVDVSTLPKPLLRVVLRCLEKEPDARYSNVAELAADLAELAPSRGPEVVNKVRGLLGLPEIEAAAVAPRWSEDEDAPAEDDAGFDLERPGQRAKRRRLGLALVLLGGAIGLIAGVVTLLFSSDDKRDDQPAPASPSIAAEPAAPAEASSDAATTRAAAAVPAADAAVPDAEPEPVATDRSEPNEGSPATATEKPGAAAHRPADRRTGRKPAGSKHEKRRDEPSKEPATAKDQEKERPPAERDRGPTREEIQRARDRRH